MKSSLMLVMLIQMMAAGCHRVPARAEPTRPAPVAPSDPTGGTVVPETTQSPQAALDRLDTRVITPPIGSFRRPAGGIETGS
jgi:hypothetical protein